MLSSRQVIEEHDLLIFVALKLDARGTITRRIDGGVHVDDLSITSVSEHDALLVVGVHAEVRRIVHQRLLRLPLEVRQVRSSRQKHSLSVEIKLEVVHLQTVSQVNVA